MAVKRVSRHVSTFAINFAGIWKPQISSYIHRTCRSISSGRATTRRGRCWEARHQRHNIPTIPFLIFWSCELYGIHERMDVKHDRIITTPTFHWTKQILTLTMNTLFAVRWFAQCAHRCRAASPTSWRMTSPDTSRSSTGPAQGISSRFSYPFLMELYNQSPQDFMTCLQFHNRHSRNRNTNISISSIWETKITRGFIGLFAHSMT